VIVGHGPSIHSGLGFVIDTMTTVRLKDGRTGGDWGSRTDYLCARSSRYDRGRQPFWLLRESYELYDAPPQRKPTTGLCAVLEVLERLGPEEIFLIGFDRLLYPDAPDPAWGPHTWLAHDKHAEHACLMRLPVKITDLRNR
jgi:hypothetical protein